VTKTEEVFLTSALKFAEDPEMLEAREEIRGSNSASYPAEFANFMDDAADLKRERSIPCEHHFVCPDDPQQHMEDSTCFLTHRCDKCDVLYKDTVAGFFEKELKRAPKGPMDQAMVNFGNKLIQHLQRGQN